MDDKGEAHKRLWLEGEAHYIATEGVKCLVCGGGERVGDAVEMRQPGSVTQEVGCLGCGSEWTDVYKLTGVEWLESGVGDE